MVPFLALILSTIFVPLNFGIPGSHFGTLELHFCGLGLPRGLQSGPLEPKVDLGWISGGFRFRALYLDTNVGHQCWYISGEISYKNRLKLT